MFQITRKGCSHVLNGGSRVGRGRRKILPLIFTSCLVLPSVTSRSCSDVGNFQPDRRFLQSSQPALAFCSALDIPRRSISTSRTSASSSKSSAGGSVDDGNNNYNSNAWDENTLQKIESLAAKIKENQFRNVIVLIGAGASVSAGIPDFRTPGTGLYDRLQNYRLPFPEAIFDLGYYRQNPMPFVDLCQSIWPGQANGPKPTITHAFLKLLQDKGCLRRIYTQNIDGLEALSGVGDDYLVECHGHFRSASCIQCRTPMEAEKCLETVVQGEAPICTTCGSLVKPDIVFFGEELPQRFQFLLDQDVDECDLLLVVGTSLLVMPVAGIPSWVSRSCPRILLNREVVGDFVYSRSDRDVVLQGDCDDSVRKLCQLLGWEKELDDIHKKA